MRKPREEQFITIKDVAREAGVSIATVSRVINQGRVSDVRKRRVLEVIKELDYEPNNSARNLASVNATKRVCLLLPTMEYRCYTELINGFKMGCSLYKYDPKVREYNYDELEYQNININLGNSSELKGIIQIGPHIESERKVVTNIYDELITFSLDKEYKDKKVGIYFDRDEFLAEYFTTNVFGNEDATIITNSNIKEQFDYYVTQSVEQAAHLINNGVTKKIYVMDEIKELANIIPNLATFPIDFFAIGTGLARIVIKRLISSVDVEESPLIINIENFK